MVDFVGEKEVSAASRNDVYLRDLGESFRADISRFQDEQKLEKDITLILEIHVLCMSVNLQFF